MTQTDSLLWLFVAIIFLTALALVFSRWAGWAKTLLVIAVVGLYLVADGAMRQIWGWPSRQQLPERFVLLATVIEEPSKNKPGALYVWVNAIENNKPSPLPRAYVLPYSKDLHSMLNEGMKKNRQGVTQLGSALPKHGSRGFSWLRPGSDEQTVVIKDLPVPQLPEK